MGFGCVLMGSVYAALLLILVFHLYGVAVVLAAVGAVAIHYAGDRPFI